jgi:hypothetical protein
MLNKTMGKLILFFVLLIFTNTEVSAQGGLLITPRRVVFDGMGNTQQLNLANTGDEIATYVVSFVQYRMTEDGEFELINEPDSGQLFADEHLRLYPRKITLAPREAQLIKVQIRNYRGLPDGEYRSHLYFRSTPDVKPLGDEDGNIDTTAVTVRLVPIFGISVPVIIRKGEITTKVSLTELSIEKINDSTQALNMTINRVGNMSVYGDIEVEFESVDNQKNQVAVVRGLAVYSPNTRRYFKINLDSGIDYSSGKFSVVYKNKSDLKPKIIAKTELVMK